MRCLSHTKKPYTLLVWESWVVQVSNNFFLGAFILTEGSSKRVFSGRKSSGELKYGIDFFF